MTKKIDRAAIRYTVFHPKTGEVFGRGLTVQAAAELILIFDDRAFEVVPTDDYEGWWNVLRSSNSRSGPLPSDLKKLSGTFARGDDKADAWNALAAQVVEIKWYHIGRNALTAMPDQRYDEYRRKALIAEKRIMSPDELDRICRIVIGPEWQRPLARILGAFHPQGERDSIDDRLVRRWASGAREMPVWAVIALGLIAERRLPPFRQRVIEMEKIVQDFESSRVAYPANLVEFLEYRADTPWQNRIGDTP